MQPRRTILSMTGDAEQNLIREIAALPRFFRTVPAGVEMGCNWIDMNVAAALMSKTAWWGNSREARKIGPSEKWRYPAHKLGLITKKMSPDGAAFCIYLIEGDPVFLRKMRLMYGNGELFVLDRKERFAALDEMCAAYLDARHKAVSHGGVFYYGKPAISA